MHISRRSFIGLSMLGVLVSISGRHASAANTAAGMLEVYKSPSCGCCDVWVNHVRNGGFMVHVTDVEDLDPIKAKFGVTSDLQSCHTAFIDGYVIEGHVPVREITRLLKERPSGTGLAVPGMPIGSPGMEQGSRRETYQVILFSPSNRSVFARY
ncbi:MAG: DUF411 domain-containing protein [Alphaproteobacteria bacterium]